MENLNMNVEKEKDYSSEEEEGYELIETDVVELNDLEKKDNDYLLVGTFGNGSGFLKSSLYADMKANDKAYKFKFMCKLGKDRSRPKKVCAEVYQLTVDNNSHLVMHTKQNLSDQSYKYIIDYFKNSGITYKRLAIFDSVHTSQVINCDAGVFCLKNSKQLQSNQLIKPKILPPPNTIQGFAAYLLTYHEVADIPAVAYLAVSSLYEVCLESVLLFQDTAVTYAFLRDKLTSNYLSSKGITNSSIQLQFKEFNSFKNHVYS